MSKASQSSTMWRCPRGQMPMKTDPNNITLEPGFTRDVTKIGHFGTGNLEVAISGPADFERAQPSPTVQEFAAIGSRERWGTHGKAGVRSQEGCQHRRRGARKVLGSMARSANML